MLTAMPRQTSVILVLTFSAGLAEGMGMAAMLPLIMLFAHGVEASSAESTSSIVKLVDLFFGTIGIAPTLGALLVIIAVLFTVKALVTYLAETVLGIVSNRFASECRRKIIRGASAARWAYFSRQPAGQLANSLTLESARMASAYSASVRTTSDGIQVGIFLVIVTLTSVSATIAAVVTSALFVGSTWSLIRSASSSGRAQSLANSYLSQRVVDFLAGFKAIKAMGIEHLVEPILMNESEAIRNSGDRLVLTAAALKALPEPILVLIVCGGLYVSVSTEIVDLSVMIVLALIFYRAAMRVSSQQRWYQVVVAQEGYIKSYDRRLSDLETAAEYLGGGKAPALTRVIEFRDLYYAHGQHQVLTGINLIIEVGTITAVVGPSGSGKTTLVDILAGLYKPDRGAVLVDGAPLESLDIRTWRSMLGYVPQDVVLLNDTIGANVALRDPSVTEEQIRHALQLAEATDFIDSLPDGLRTQVGERGAKLSGGQRQRLGIARALVRNPRLLVLDEATTALDPLTERAVCATLKRLVGSVTMIAISHQPTIATIADLVCHLSNGRMVCQKVRDNHVPHLLDLPGPSAL
jgi:ATP-binding cassette subfamily C protein